MNTVTLRRVHPPAPGSARRIAPHAPMPAPAAERQPAAVVTSEPTRMAAPLLRRVAPLRLSGGVLVDVAAPVRRIAAPLPTTPLELSIVDKDQLATGRGLTYEWEFFLADVLDRVGTLESGSGSSGGGSGGGTGYRHVQTTPATVWSITHALGYDPAGVLVISADGYLLDGVGVQYLTSGQTLRLSTDIAVAGVAYLS